MKAELRYTQSGSSLKSLWAVAAILFMLFGVGFVVGGGEDSKPANNPKSKNETAPTTGTPDNELDKHVENEAKKYGDPPGDKKLLPPLKVTAKSPRTVSDMAARIDAILDRKRKRRQDPRIAWGNRCGVPARAYIDIVGVIPGEAKAVEFIASKDGDKRQNLSRNYWPIRDTASTFAHYWHDLLVKRDPDNNRLIKTPDVFIKWLTHRFNSDGPWDEIVRSMLTAKGDQSLAGETFFILANSDNGQPAANRIVGTASALFLGNQLMCADMPCASHDLGMETERFLGPRRLFRQEPWPFARIPPRRTSPTMPHALPMHRLGKPSVKQRRIRFRRCRMEASRFPTRK